MKELVRSYPHLEEELVKVYYILSNSDFEIEFEYGEMRVYPKVGSIEFDGEEGLVIVDYEYKEEYEERQEILWDKVYDSDRR